ncbi:MAG: LytTR family DNA-binding domain-containing protein [Clostridiales Family XIII bacterium]|jgi:DNA-binding LytR/AlgR family response regulator|nr:LytTR family DNA-binding domain-containing protein [Clostridiales Family XIII bacterium]
MIRIAIVEDEAAYRETLVNYIHRYKQESGELIEVKTFKDGFEILEGYKHEYEIILLDVQMPFVDGMLTAKEIRTMDTDVVLIFITNMAQYAIHGYAVDAMDYVLKPISYFAFSQRLERAISRMKKRTEHNISINVKGGSRQLNLSDIFYIESQNHNLIYHTSQGDFISSGALKNIEAELQSMYFERGNSGYLINLRHVDALQDGCAIVNGEALALSRSKKKTFMDALTKYIGEVMK